MTDTVMFLKLSFDGGQMVAGTSETIGFVDQIAIESFSWGAGANHNETNQRQASKDETPLKMRSIGLSKFYDRSSLAITTGASKRRHVESALLSFITLPLGEDDRMPARLMAMEIKDGFIESVRLHASESGKSIVIKEDFSISFSELKLSYWVVSDGVMGRRGPVKTFSHAAPRSGE
jgi:type VI protein secretion system component Hcp